MDINRKIFALQTSLTADGVIYCDVYGTINGYPGIVSTLATQGCQGYQGCVTHSAFAFVSVKPRALLISSRSTSGALGIHIFSCIDI